jgi:hypothetical protein
LLGQWRFGIFGPGLFCIPAFIQRNTTITAVTNAKLWDWLEVKLIYLIDAVAEWTQVSITREGWGLQWSDQYRSLPACWPGGAET